jgi:ATP-dependent Zn protease
MNKNEGPRQGNQLVPPMRQWILIAVVILAAAAVPYFLNSNRAEFEEVTMPDIVSAIEAGDVETLTVRGDLLVANMTDGTSLSARKESNISTVEALQILGASPESLKTLPIVVKNPNASAGSILGSVFLFLPLLFLGFLHDRCRAEAGAGGCLAI